MPLAELLRQAEWGPRQLVTSVNARLVSQGRERLRLDPTAGYSWVRRGFRPRLPIPDVVAAVLTERLGYGVTATQLWPGHRDDNRGHVPAATDGLDAIGGVDDMVRELRELAISAVTPGSPIAEASGADLAAVVVEQFRDLRLASRDRSRDDRVLPDQVDVIAVHVAALRRLDDRHGGGALCLRYATAEFRAVVELAEYASYDVATGRRLLVVVADLAQLLGWLSFDSGRCGAAERYLLLSLGVCRAAGASDRAANVIGMLSYISAFAGHGRHAVRLAEAAAAECSRPDPFLRARLLGRDATAAAADGDVGRFRRQSQDAAAMLHQHRNADRPLFLYYLSAEQLAAETGQALVVLARQVTTGRDKMLSEAVTSLAGAVSAKATPGPGGSGPAYPRSALLHATYLVRACLLRGDLEQAVAAMQAGLRLLPLVQSPRARAHVAALRPALARRSRSPLVRDLLEELDQASSVL